MDEDQLKLVVAVTKSLKERGYRYLAVVEDDVFVIRIFKGLDES
jgi:hypothetical protein